MSEHGRVLAVNWVRLGSELIGAHASAATTLLIEDGSDFDERGGTLQVGTQTVTYSAAVHNADDSATLTLSAGLSAAADDGDPVLLWDASRDVQASEVYAEVEVDGEAGGDPISAIVAHHLIRELPEGIRSLVGESVRISEDGDDWIVVDVLGVSEAAGMKAEANDAYTLTTADVTAGTATIPLTHPPIDESVKLTFGTVPQEPTNYTVDYDAATITFPLDGWESAGLRFSVHYWYVRGPVKVRSEAAIVATSASYGVESMTWPTGSQVGDYVLLSTMRGPNDSFSNLNGWDLIGETASVTHAAYSGTWTYKLVLYGKIRQAGDVFPTRVDGTGQSLFVLTSMRGPGGVMDEAFATLADGTTAQAPTTHTGRIRVFGTVSAATEITPARGTILANFLLVNQDIDLCVVEDASPTPLSATTNGAAGWCLATVGLVAP